MRFNFEKFKMVLTFNYVDEASLYDSDTSKTTTVPYGSAQHKSYCLKVVVDWKSLDKT